MTEVIDMQTAQKAPRRRAAAPIPLDQKVILRPRQVVELGYVASVVTLWRLRKEPGFPPTIRLGANSIGFKKVDLDAWVASREPA
jgi:predicted DNA-binding transcriptional regulator AlpA